MRYFTKDLWCNLNSDIEEVQIQAEKEWEEHYDQYMLEFQQTSQLLSKRFVNSIKRRDYLHDYIIHNFSITNNGKGKYICTMQLSNGNEVICISMRNVTQVKFDVTSFKNCVQGNLAWGYCEFSQSELGNIQLSVLCDLDNELFFEFKNISLTLLTS